MEKRQPYAKQWFEVIKKNKGKFKNLTKKQLSYISDYDSFLKLWDMKEGEEADEEQVSILLLIQRHLFENVAYPTCLPFELEEMEPKTEEEEKTNQKEKEELVSLLKYDDGEIGKTSLDNFNYFCGGSTFELDNRRRENEKFPWGKGNHNPFDKESRNILYHHMYRVWNEINRHEKAWPFQEPVDTSQVTDYLNVVKKPMDLAKIHGKLKNKLYRSKSEFATDLKMIFYNCRLYNADDGNIFRETGNCLERFTNTLLRTIPDNITILKKNVFFGMRKKSAKETKKKVEEMIKQGDQKIQFKLGKLNIPKVDQKPIQVSLPAIPIEIPARVEVKPKPIIVEEKKVKKGSFGEQAAVESNRDQMGYFFLDHYDVKPPSKKSKNNRAIVSENFDPYNRHYDMKYLSSSMPRLSRRWNENLGGGGLLVADRSFPKIIPQPTSPEEMEYDACHPRSKRVMDNINSLEKIRKMRMFIDTRDELDEDEELCIPSESESRLTIGSEARAMSIMRCSVAMFLTHAGFEEVTSNGLDILADVLSSYVFGIGKSMKRRMELNFLEFPLPTLMCSVLESFGIQEPTRLSSEWKEQLDRTKFSIKRVDEKLKRIIKRKKRPRGNSRRLESDRPHKRQKTKESSKEK